MQYQFKHRVIYEDTDAGGVVYYAKYLAYFERGRTELIRQMGISLKQLKDENGLAFAVVRVECDYRAPALYDDEITIETAISDFSGATITFDQKALRNGKLLVEAKTTLITVDLKTFRARRLPEEIAAKLKTQA
jgi:acyl-CoA thioester hydrolase